MEMIRSTDVLHRVVGITRIGRLGLGFAGLLVYCLTAYIMWSSTAVESGLIWLKFEFALRGRSLASYGCSSLLVVSLVESSYTSTNLPFA